MVAMGSAAHHSITLELNATNVDLWWPNGCQKCPAMPRRASTNAKGCHQGHFLTSVQRAEQKAECFTLYEHEESEQEEQSKA